MTNLSEPSSDECSNPSISIDDCHTGDGNYCMRRNKVQFVVTGFGPFQGVPTNPTTAIVQQLSAQPSSSADAKSSKNISLSYTVVKTHIFATAAETVQKELNCLYHELLQTVNYDTITIIMHVGVHKGTQFHLEKNAYNDATFRIPDEQGYQPQQVKIIPNEELGTCHETSLPIENICRELSLSSSYPVVASTNPGRFVCNYTYCLSAAQCENIQKEHWTCAKENKRIFHSLFVHVPKFSVIPMEEQMKFLYDLMEVITKQLVLSIV